VEPKIWLNREEKTLLTVEMLIILHMQDIDIHKFKVKTRRFDQEKQLTYG
jgi:hypothetical protein